MGAAGLGLFAEVGIDRGWPIALPAFRLVVVELLYPHFYMDQAFLSYYRCPYRFADFRPTRGQSKGFGMGYFRFGSDLTCYGAAGVQGQQEAGVALPDVLSHVRIEGSTCLLPFNPTDIANNLRYERYVDGVRKVPGKKLVRGAYYWVRPHLTVSVRRHLQRAWLKGWDKKPFPCWPVDRTVDRMFEKLMALSLQAHQEAQIPFIWFWPEGKSSCAIMTHDVETALGLEFVPKLMDINDSFGIKSSFQIVPEERYVAGEDVLSAIRSRGFEINVHDLKHDGHLFEDHQQFLRSAARINEHGIRFGSKGFRSAALYRNLNWYGALSFSYDMSVPNVGHLDPQPGGCCTVMPYFIGKILELPVTTTQDYSLFNVLGTYSLDLWREQIGHIMQQHGLISFIVHPDYLDNCEARSTYTALLEHLAVLRSEAMVWIAFPAEVDTWWRQRSRMKLVPDGGEWQVEGQGAERARVAYATLEKDQVTYHLS
jgi:hypothetical protein